MNSYNGNTDEISIQAIVTNAIAKGITSQDVTSADDVEQIEQSKLEGELEGETKDD